MIQQVGKFSIRKLRVGGVGPPARGFLGAVALQVGRSDGAPIGARNRLIARPLYFDNLLLSPRGSTVRRAKHCDEDH